MLDPKLLRTEIERVAQCLKRRGFALNIDQYQSLERTRKALQQKTQALQNQRNVLSKQIAQAKAQSQPLEPLLAQVSDIKSQLEQQHVKLITVQQQLEAFMLHLPNLLADDVPDGTSDKDNLEISRWGEPRPLAFQIKDHVSLGEQLGGLDFNAAAQLSGARFVVMRGAIAKLNRVLVQWMLDLHINQHGYEEVYVPYLVNSQCLYGTGQLPKFREDQFSIAGSCDLALIPTAEVPVTNLIRGEKRLLADQLPIKMVAHTPCFRREAGSYGKDTRGMIRQHQFEKVELVHIVSPDQAKAAHEELLSHAEKVLQLLDLPYRVVNLCAGDLGFSAMKTYDLEVWIPSQNTYREISSCSHFGDFQARRMQARYYPKPQSKPQWIHTLNGSGLAVSRTLVAIIENYQNEDGSITIPKALSSYMGGVDKLYKA